jgi:ABC-2 type transport system permease protein
LIFLAGMFLNAAIIGILVLALVLRFGHRAEVAAWSFSYLLFLLCGLYYPVTILPPGSGKWRSLCPLPIFSIISAIFTAFPSFLPAPWCMAFCKV